MLLSLRRAKVSSRLTLLLIATVVIASIPFISMVRSYQADLIQAKQDKTKQIIEVAFGMLEHYYQQEKSGAISLENAKLLAADAIRQLRYDQGDYFWINDLTPNMVMHPIKPQLQGKNVGGVKDPSGKTLFIEMVDVAKSQGEGFVHYLWPKPGSEVDVEKVSYIKLFKPWGWVVGTGVYVDDVDALVMSRIQSMVVYVSGALILLIAFSFIIGRSITNPSKATQLALEDIAKGEGNLSTQLAVEGNDEFTAIAKAFNQFTQKIRSSIQNITPVSHSITQSAQLIDDITDIAARKANEQMVSVNSVAAAMTQLQSNNHEVANSAQNAAQAAQVASDKSNHGQDAINKASSFMTSLSHSLNETEQSSIKLSEEAANVGSVLEVIRGVAEQTNLLALNAAIEAARAGEQGRGFAVVADEVRTLATRTQKSTDEIEEIVDSLQTRARELSTSMGKTQRQSTATLEQADLAKQILDEINQQVHDIMAMNHHIAEASTQQSAATEEINRNLSQFTEHADQTHQDVQQLTQTSEQLSKDSHTLSESVNAFKLS
ncbi:methyl-accepting chemotaxis protein [Vibrio viridaestus]|uniref:Methyl-accepting chemotaxis protein n=1 Tax=Vibrio viridaestus TaxID=2487322 RepID=A0A3N9TAL3_9VIBR|nr:methyl-accepting chemotaxis protein [Vibrio viridaestus]RQW61161.1 methyl-accepting chemotaxis protein [Vibrio viridaestus]